MRVNVEQIARLSRLLLLNGRDLLPLVPIVGFFHLIIIGKPLLQLREMLVGLAFVLFGLTLFVQGLTMSLFELGEDVAKALARRGNTGAAALIRFRAGIQHHDRGTRVVRDCSHGGGCRCGKRPVHRQPSGRSVQHRLQYSVSASVGLGVALGCLRIVMGWRVVWLVLGGYGFAALITLASQAPLRGVALDAGTAATSAINIPLITALGVGLATAIRSRNPLTDGFGLVALASLMPVLTMLLAAIAVR